MQRRYAHAPEIDPKHQLHGYSPLLTRLLINRGVTTTEAAYAFLHPDYVAHMHDPFLMHDMEKAVVRIFEAVEAKEKIVVYADYDCDGIPGAVILHDFLTKLGHENFYVYIPDRHEEGYGLNKEAVEKFISEEVNLIVTIDLGTSDIDTIALAAANGIDVIVTDHHLPHEHLPKAYALVNPKLGSYPEPMLCGSGVMFKLVQGFIKKYGEYFADRITTTPALTNGWEKWMLDMAGLATLSDMVPLTGENRVIASFGLQVFRKSPRPGVTSLLRKLKIAQATLVEEDLTFMVTPRINAASRMDTPMRAFELLSERDGLKAGATADHLTKINDERKRIVAEIMEGVLPDLKARELGPIIVVGHASWRVGVLGIVAGKVMDEFDRPAFVWGGEGMIRIDGETRYMKGSCRSNGAVNVVALMEAAGEIFSTYGGHELAGGFSISEESALVLEELLCEKYAALEKEIVANPANTIDTILSLSDVNEQTCKSLALMAPFGLGNPKPVFLFPGVRIVSSRMFGKEKNHLEIVVTDIRGYETTAIAFFSTPESFTKKIVPDTAADLVATIEKSYFAGRTTIRLRILDVR